MIEYRRKGSCHYKFDSELLEDELQSSFSVSYWQRKEAIIGSAVGRGTTWFIRSQTLDMALRHYRRGGLFGRVVKDGYLFWGVKHSRSFAEFELLHHLSQLSVNVPRPVAACVVRRGLFYRADLLSEKIPHSHDLIDALQHGPLAEEIYRAIGEQVRRMHDAQVCHTDLNIKNILIDKDSKVWIIDFDKCGIKAGERWKQANIERLKRSVIKERARHGIYWDDAMWRQFEKGYWAK